MIIYAWAWFPGLCGWDMALALIYKRIKRFSNNDDLKGVFLFLLTFGFCPASFGRLICSGVYWMM